MKKIVLVGLAVVGVLVLSGCKLDTTGSSYEEHYYVDEETGVNYLWINSSAGVAITPRYNADGSLYVTK